MSKYCVIDEQKLCDDCGECDRCDLDPNKLCDNCCKCLTEDEDDPDYRSVSLNFLNGSSTDGLNGDDSDYSDEQIEMPQIDKELLQEWEDILSMDAQYRRNHNTPNDFPTLRAVRSRRGRRGG